MKSLISVVIGIALLFTLAACVPFSSRPMPDIRGRETVSPGPSAPVTILRDQNGITHVTAQTRNDAYFGQGYAHAQDRFFQMEFWRRIGQGRISELFGSSTLGSDIYLRAMAFDRVAQEEYDIAPAWVQDALDAYADGVNAYIADKKPGQLSFEFALLAVQGVDVEIDPWEGWHSLAWGKVMSQDLGVDMVTELRRLDMIRAVGTERVQEYYAPYRYEEQPTILLDAELPVRRPDATAAEWLDPKVAEIALANVPAGVSGAVIAVADATEDLGIGKGLGIGSNSWVVSGEHTASGKPIVANDMHLSIQMPSIWYQNTLRYTVDGRTVGVHGVSFAGIPGVIVGHNDEIAWGFTNAYADEQDLYIERLNPENPDQYLVGSSWQDMETRIERIEVSGADDPLFVKIRETRNGPIVTDNGGYVPYSGFFVEPVQLFPTDMQLSALALKWSALEPQGTVHSVMLINEAQSFDEFREALRVWGGPTQASVCADVDGNFGYVLTGPVPIRGAGTGALPAPGWDDAYQWQGFIPREELPWVKNPERGFVASANNPAVSPEYGYTLGYTLVPGYRAQRITELLEDLVARGGITSEDMQTIQLDSFNISAGEILPYVESLDVSSLGTLLEPFQVLKPKSDPDDDTTDQERAETRIAAAENAIAILAGWDHFMELESSGAAVFTRFFLKLIDEIFQDEFTPEFWDTGRPIGSTSFMQNRIELLLRDPDGEWWDNKWTADHRETRDEVIAEALAEAYLSLEEELGENSDKWEWGDIHGATFRNQTLGESGIGIIERMFNRGPYPTRGGLDQVGRFGIDLDEPYEVTGIASMRMILDLSDWTTGMLIHPTGQSGHIRSKHYDDFIQDFVDGVYYVHPWTEEAIENAAKARLILE